MTTRAELMEGVVAVILGGRSAERAISLKTGAAFSKALSARGYRVEEVDAEGDMAARLLKLGPTAAVIALHGRWGEDGCVQGLLECLGVPYTGSGVLASAVAMDKGLTKRLLSASGVATPDYEIFTSIEDSIELPFDLPVVVKPSREGSSVGIAMVFEEAELLPAVFAAAALGGPVLVERYVKGREFSVAVLEGAPLGAIEIVPARTFYDYEAKYGANSGTRYLYPPSIPAALNDEIGEAAARAYELLGCGGVCRADFMIDEAERPWFIEINTLPGMTETSLVPKIAAGVGISFEDLCERLLLGARLNA